MNGSINGFSALIVAVGFVVVFSAPVWIAARMVGARHPTLLRAALALVAGALGSVVSTIAGGGWALLLAPLSYLAAFKYVLGTSFLGAILLALLALLGYAAISYFVGGGVPSAPIGTVTT